MFFKLWHKKNTIFRPKTRVKCQVRVLYVFYRVNTRFFYLAYLYNFAFGPNELKEMFIINFFKQSVFIMISKSVVFIFK